jgi:hypothetical protein
MQDSFKYGLVVFAIFLGLIFLSQLPNYSATRGEKITHEQLKLLGDEAKRMAYVAKQDRNPFLSVLHGTIALTKIQTLKNLGPSHRISQKLDMNIDTLREDILAHQRLKTQEINSIYPSVSLFDVEIDWFV